MTLQNSRFFYLQSAHEALSYRVFHLSNLLQAPMTIEWSTVSSLAMSHVVVRGLAVVTALIWSLSTSNNQPLHSSSSRLSSPLQNFLNHHCTVHSLAVPGPDALLMLPVVSASFVTHFGLKKKRKEITQICFLSNIVSIV